MSDNGEFWFKSTVPVNSAAITLDTLERGVAALEIRQRLEPMHLIRGRDWCDVCGLRSWGWTHGHPSDKDSNETR